MTSPKALKDKIFEKVINSYLSGVLQHPQSIEMREGMLHIRDVEGPKKTRSVEARLEAMEQQVFKCQGMVERGLNANHMMITEFTSKHRIDANDIWKHLSRLYDRIDHLQAQMYDLQNQNWLFPRTREAVEVAVETSREECRTAGEEVDANAGWSVEEIATGAKARMYELARSLERLQSAGLEMVKGLWPNAVEPAAMSRLSRWLEAGSSRLDAWRESAARDRAYMALRLAKS
ncbi:40S ribosomal protein S5-1 [Hordeum vulgare]|nr:40S ribosomal protein S5-1 [Hordeum vulgare]